MKIGFIGLIGRHNAAADGVLLLAAAMSLTLRLWSCCCGVCVFL
jgi:hypothetical protein